MTMTDRELLELAAKASGVCLHPEDKLVRSYGNWGCDTTCTACKKDPSDSVWNPLSSDGDALRLLCKLKLSLNSNSATVGVGGYTPGWDHVFAQEQIIDGDAQSAHRRAIVRAAAEIGKAMQEKH